VEPAALSRIASGGLGLLVLAGGLLLWSRRHDGPSAPLEVRPRVTAPEGVRIRVEVINTTPVRGLARRATFFLRDAGFNVVRFTTDTALRDSTLVLDRSGHHDWARLVSRALGGARLEARPDSSRYLDVTVLIGGDWRPPAKPFYP